ncbi:hypothetical protein BU16DRAFT_229432 [Lophium mytilinum]|uniref:Uncharacterized protein n=1 Tax=Lophium mytilinum TaxID=390894 RepID=A0A6A6Q744_9PEZI|nr:hypothetical protein BU16DRAFT_229432 [Lophium mytilinum]
MMLLAVALVLLLPQVYGYPRIDPNNWNSTSSCISGTPAPVTRSPTLAPPYPTPSTSAIGRPSPTGTSPSLNATSGECIINVPSASVDYWLEGPLEWATTSLMNYYGNSSNITGPLLSASPVTETLDLTLLLEDYAYTTPLAASTSVITINGIKPIPSPGLIAATAVNDYVLDPPPLATVSVGSSVAYSDTPFVYFSAYEVERQVPATNKDGKFEYQTSTASYQLESPFVYEYDGQDLQGQSTAVGDVPTDFQLSIPQSSCFAGSWRASITVLIVVELVYNVEHLGTPFIVHIESSAFGLTAPGPSTTEPAKPKAHIESSVTDPDLRNTADPTDPTGDPNRVHKESSVTTTDDGRIAASTGGPRIVHIESSTTPIPLAPIAPSSVAIGISVNLPGATNLPQLISQLRSFITAIAHIESTQPPAAGEGGPTAQAQVTHSLSSDFFVVGSETLKPGPSSVFVMGSQTLSPGGPPVTIGGTPVSLAPYGSAIVVGGSTIPAPTPGPSPAINIQLGSSIITAAPATATGGGIVLPGGGTLLPGSATAINGETISLVPSGTAIVVGGSTVALEIAVPSSAVNIQIGSSTITAALATAAGGGLIFPGGVTLLPGSATVINGETISLAPSGTAVVVGGSTVALEITVPSSAVNIQVGSSTITAALATATGGGLILPGGITLLPGSATVINGETISLAPFGTAIVVGGFTSSLPKANLRPPPPVLSIGPLTVTGNAASQYFITAGQTLTPGGTVTYSGTIISLGSSADYLVVGGSTRLLPSQTLDGPSAQITPPPLTIGNGVYTPIPGSGTSYLIGGSLLTPGGVITVANTKISLGPKASFLVVNGATTTLDNGPITTNAPILTIGTAIVTAQPGNGTTFIVDGHTLTPGGVITVSGTVISLSPSATALVIVSSGSSTSTETLFPATKIMASTAIQTGNSGSTASAGATPTGTAVSSHGAAHSIHTSGSSLSLFTLALGYLLSWL